MSYKRFTDDEIELAGNINIVDYLNTLNLQTKRAGKTLKIEGYGGLYIDPVKNKWNCFSQGKGGGPIQLVMFLENKTWVEAMKSILNKSYTKEVKPITRRPQNKENQEFILPKKNNTYRHMIAYLINTRQIDKDIVYKIIKEEKLYEDTNKNCVFIGYDKDNNPRYANKRGTNTNIPFKGEIRNSDKSHPFYFGDNGDTVYIFESPIDAMSHASIYKLKGLDWEKQYRLSLGGLTEIGLDTFLKENPQIKNIILCLDTDKPGQEAEQKLLNKYTERNYNTSLYYISEKDMNDELIELKKSLDLENDWELEI